MNVKFAGPQLQQKSFITVWRWAETEDKRGNTMRSVGWESTIRDALVGLPRPRAQAGLDERVACTVALFPTITYRRMGLNGAMQVVADVGMGWASPQWRTQV